VQRFRHPSGLERLVIERVLHVPAALDADRERRSSASLPLPVPIEDSLWPGCRWVELELRIDNAASDHRLRALFASGDPTPAFHAATTFDTAARQRGRQDDGAWIHPAPDTFVHQGWVAKNGLAILAPGLNEAEVCANGDVAVTLLRATGWLSRPDLETRPDDAGPALPTPGAQCPGLLTMRLALAVAAPELVPGLAHDFELGLQAVAAGDAPLLAEGRSLLAIEPGSVVLSAWKPAERGAGSVLRILNPLEEPVKAQVRLGLPVSEVQPVRLDETDEGPPIALREGRLDVDLPPHALRSFWIPDPGR
jgi:alpha-mannosidase/mannosylglycerate hydrolase